jgi:hypothetical protein
MTRQNPKGGEVQTETGEMLKGPKPVAQQQSSQPSVKQQGGQHVNEGQQQAGQQAGQGDERTPDKPIGQVAYADGRKKQNEGAVNPQVSNLEPEKQGGIGGP